MHSTFPVGLYSVIYLIVITLCIKVLATKETVVDIDPRCILKPVMVV